MGYMILNLTTRNEPAAADLPPIVKAELRDLLGRACPENSSASVRTAIALTEIVLHNGLGVDGGPDPLPQRVVLDGKHPASHRVAQEMALRGIEVTLATNA